MHNALMLNTKTRNRDPHNWSTNSEYIRSFQPFFVSSKVDKIPLYPIQHYMLSSSYKLK